MSVSLPSLTLQRVDRLWDRAEHNAFTDICYFNNAYWLVFREGETHVSVDGVIVILTSENGIDWQLAAELQMPSVDLRDPKIVVTPEQQLLITCAGVLQQPQRHHQSFLYFSDDGYLWSQAHAVGPKHRWLWRTRFFGDTGFAVGYTRAEETTVLYRLENKQFHPWVDPLFSKASHGLGYPNEHDLFALHDERIGCLLRRDADTATAQLGIAGPPYKQWQWTDLGIRIGGPVVFPITVNSKRYYLCAIRLYEPVRTALCWLDIEQGRIEEILSLPSGGDTSYAGLVQRDDRILCSYYSSHEDKSAIYLAELHISG